MPPKPQKKPVARPEVSVLKSMILRPSHIGKTVISSDHIPSEKVAVTKADISNLATKDDVGQLATKADLDQLAKKLKGSPQLTPTQQLNQRLNLQTSETIYNDHLHAYYLAPNPAKAAHLQVLHARFTEDQARGTPSFRVCHHLPSGSKGRASCHFRPPQIKYLLINLINLLHPLLHRGV